jgi:hypothetical protein
VKTCSCCLETKPTSEFYAKRGACKACVRSKQQGQYRSNRDRQIAWQTVYYVKHREEILRKAAEKRAALKVQLPVEPIPSEKACGKCGAVKALSDFQKHRMGKYGLDSTCRVCKLAAKSAWQKANPERNAFNAMSYGIRKRNVAVNDLTLAQWAMLKERYNFSCAYCGDRVPVLTQDHVLALSRGGNHTMSNVVPACLRCNAAKGNRPVELFIKVSSGKRLSAE